MPSNIITTAAKLLVACLVVGLVLSMLGLSPAEFFHSMLDAVSRAFAWGRDLLGWAFEYVVIGAAVVIPLWLAVLFLRWINRR